MADSWEEADDDWDTSKAASTSAGLGPVLETKGEAIRAQINAPDLSKFDDEDKDFKTSAPAYSVPVSQPKKKEEKKYRDPTGPVEELLDYPVAEKLRQQQLVEQADYDAARDLFQDVRKPLDSYLPKSLKEFDEFATEIVARHVTIHKDSKQYKAFVKSLIKAMLEPMGSEESKDIETCVAGVRSDKIKAEKAKAADKAAKGKGATLNTGGKGKSGGLDEYIYDDSALPDGDAARLRLCQRAGVLAAARERQGGRW